VAGRDLETADAVFLDLPPTEGWQGDAPRRARRHVRTWSAHHIPLLADVVFAELEGLETREVVH
jgi:hypothetical protein